MGNILSVSDIHIADIFSNYRRDPNFLRVKMSALGSAKEGMEEKIKFLKVPPKVQSWIDSVNNLDEMVKEILKLRQETSEEGENDSLWTWISRSYSSFRSNYRRGNDIMKALELVRELESERERWGDNFVEHIPFDSVDTNRPLPEGIPSSSRDVVGMEGLVSKLLKFLADDKVGVIGIYGMAGVGKTTLVNQLLDNHIGGSCSSSSELAEVEGRSDVVMFDKVIRVAVSQNFDIAKIQEEIGKRLGLSEEENFKGRDQTTRADFLSAWLSRMRFLLVLDGMWTDVDLSAVGIPHLHCFGNRCSKVILTTRDASVCGSMGVNRKGFLKVDCLNEKHSWELFRVTIGWDVDELKIRGILNIAEEMVRRSGGLPLVLVTIAQAMFAQETVHQWRNALYTLKNFPRQIHGMDSVFRLLKSSYDNLEDDQHRYCLQFAALFPENEHIPMSEMVDCMVGAFLVEGGSDMDDLRIKAANIVTQLRRASLLGVTEIEQRELDPDLGANEKVECVKLHSAVRDMILDSLDGKIDVKNKIMPFAINNTDGIYRFDVEAWDGLMKSSTKTSASSSVTTEEEEQMNVPLLHSGWVVTYPTNFFEHFPNLRVLNLSRTPNLEEIPASVCKLKFLRYLNLSHTRIKTLRKEMINLRSLMQLDLSCTLKLREIPEGIFSSFSKLRSLDLYRCGSRNFHFTPVNSNISKEIGDLRSLKDVRLRTNDDSDVKFLVQGPDSLSNSITKLAIGRVDLFKDDDPLFPRMVERLKKLEWLLIYKTLSGDKDLRIGDYGDFPQLKHFAVGGPHFRHIIIKGMPLNELTSLVICNCSELRNIARHWKLPNLRSLRIYRCRKMVELVEPSQEEDDGNDEPFLPKLEHITLKDMRNLVRISSCPLQLPSLVKFEVVGCPELQDISMVSSPNNVEMRCTKHLWEHQLRWENYEDAPPLISYIPSYISDD